MTQALTTEVLPDIDYAERVKDILNSQHAIMGIFGNVFVELGGQQFLLEWARDNPTKYITLLTKMVPTMSPVSGFQGDVNITINPALPRTSLDD